MQQSQALGIHLEQHQDNIAKTTISIFPKKGQEGYRDKIQISPQSKEEILVIQETKRSPPIFLTPSRS